MTIDPDMLARIVLAGHGGASGGTYDDVRTARREAKAALGLDPDARTLSFIKSRSAREARKLLGLTLDDAAAATGLTAGFLMGMELSGRSTGPQRAALQRAYEARGLVFSRGGCVAWAE